MPSRSTSSTEPDRPALGRPSAAAEAEPTLRAEGDAASAAWRAEGAETGWCLLRVASVVGVRHRLAGQATDDSYAWAHADGVLVAAVADGIGSVDGSAGAAERACRAAVTAGVAWDPAHPEDAVRRAVTAADEAAAGGGATTLVVALMRRGGTCAVARIGDSSAFVISGDGPAIELFEPPDPDRADTATPALPAKGMDPDIRVVSVDPGGVLVLATDGIADPWRDGPATVAPAMVEALRERPHPVQLLALADFSRQGCHDDRTILAVWPRPDGDEDR